MHRLCDWVNEVELPQDPFLIQGIDARGWPFRVLWCLYPYDYEPDFPATGVHLPDSIMPAEEADWNPPAALPCMPVWGGLLADVAFYAAAWMGMFTVPRWIALAARRRRGLCPACAYPRAGLGLLPCPECGLI